jgi:hypothetical protein
MECTSLAVGLKFIVTYSPGAVETTQFLQNVYDLYVDFVLKVGAFAIRSFVYLIVHLFPYFCIFTPEPFL